MLQTQHIGANISSGCLITQAVHLRSLWWRKPDVAVKLLSILQIVATASFLGAESVRKSSMLLGHRESTAPDVLAGIFSKSLFMWLNSLFRRGFGRSLLPKDLDSIDPDLTSVETYQRFESKWLRNTRQNKKASLFWITCQTLRYDMLLPVLPRLVNLGTSFAQPFLVKTLIVFISTPADDPDDRGPLLVLAIASTYICIGVFQSLYRQSVVRLHTKLRVCLVLSRRLTTKLFGHDHALPSLR